MKATFLEKLYQQSLRAIPYSLTPTGITQGSFEADDSQFVEYAEEFTFSAGKLFDQDLLAGGWVELRQDEDQDIYITGFFGIARDGDWEKGSILPEYTALQGNYDLKAKKWEFAIDTY